MTCYLSVCSGIEAASVAWRPLGWSAVAYSEIDAFPSAVLAHHYPHTLNFGDMLKFKEWPDADFDVLVGGTPCQSFSVAGLRGGLADPRGNLMLTYLAIADRYRPEWLVWENVPGVLSSSGGRDFGTLLGGLGQLRYGFAYRVLDAQYYGVPQRRRRVFVVANSRSWQRAASVLFERASLRGDSPPSREAGEDVAPTISARTKGGGGLGTDFDCDGGLIPERARALTSSNQRIDAETETLIVGAFQETGHGWWNDDPVAQSLRDASAGGSSYANLITHSLRADGFDASEDGTGRGTPLVPVPFDTTQITSPGNYSAPKAGDPCHPLASGQHPPAVAFGWQNSSQQGASASASASVTPTLDKSKVPGIGYGAQVRRLTPRECERLQGFPDDYTLIQYRGKPAADGLRYKALGNSMAVPCMAWLGQRLHAVQNATMRQAA